MQVLHIYYHIYSKVPYNTFISIKILLYVDKQQICWILLLILKIHSHTFKIYLQQIIPFAVKWDSFFCFILSLSFIYFS